MRNLGEPDPDKDPFGLSADEYTQEFIDDHGALGAYAATLIKTPATGFFGTKARGFDLSDFPTVSYFLRGDYNNPLVDHWGGRYNQPDPTKNYYVSGMEGHTRTS